MGKVLGGLLLLVGFLSGLVLDKIIVIPAPVEVLASMAVVLGVGVLFLVVLSQLRQQMINEPQACPKCHKGVTRVHRTSFDRLLSKFVPNLRRYACSDPFCGWTSIVIVREGRSHSHERSHRSVSS